MVTINRETDYAVRFILHLAGQPQGRRMTVQQIGRKWAIPPALARRIATQLTAAGLLASTRGSGGGVALARRPAEISLLDVLEAMQGRPILNLCTVDQACSMMSRCPVHDVWVDLYEIVTDRLRQTTFAQLAERGTHPTKGEEK